MEPRIQYAKTADGISIACAVRRLESVSQLVLWCPRARHDVALRGFEDPVRLHEVRGRDER